MKIKFIPSTLAAALLLTAIPSPGSESATAKLVWSGSLNFDYKAVSPDGRYLAGVDWTTGNLAIYEIATGQRQAVTSEGSWEDSGEYTYRCAWSPDGKQIAYLWCIHGLNRNTQLRVIGLDGGRPRTLCTATNGWDYVIPHAWSADGTQILASDRPNEKARLILVSAADGTERELKMPEGRGWLGPFGFSPDDKSLLYTSTRKVEGKQQMNVSLMPVGSDSTNAVEDLAEGRCLGWTPDGKGFLFLSEEEGASTIWLQRMASGKRDGKPQKLRTVSDWGGAMGFTRSGSFFYSIAKQSSKRDRIYEVALDPKTGRVISKPTVLVEGLDGASCSYSPDGRQIAYACATTHDNYTLHIRSTATGQERKLPIEVRNLGGGTDRPRWSPDGRFVMMSGNAPRDGQVHTRILDALTGKRVHSLASDAARHIIAGEWSRDGKSIFYACGLRSSKEWQVLMRNLETGMEKEIFRSSATPPRDLRLLPDGERLVAGRLILPVAGGEARGLPELRPAPTGKAAWSADGKWIYFPAKGPAEDKSELYRISVRGGEVEPLGLPMVQYYSISVHPDGDKLLLAARETDAKSEVWALKNLVSK